MKPSLCYSSAALHSVKHKNDEPRPILLQIIQLALKLGEINLTSIASSRFRRNRASDRSTTRHRVVHRVAATPSLVGRRRRRSPAAGEFLRVASRRRWFVAADPTRCRAVAAGVTAVTLPALPAASLCLAGATARWPLLTPARPFALPIGRVTAAPLHCWPAAASRRRSRRRAGESPDLLCRRAGVTESPTTERHRALPRSRVTARPSRPSVPPSTLPP
ncbi:hypothetical protein Scep_026172 [Stephania cephalantha]|uniref:Uncharacterized protein n=1 Tax=Stephania cephalantha TaxID=152367 RepID=A0AAP0ERV3_9MAGN